MHRFKVAVIDQGVEKEHERLKGCMLSGFTVRKTADGFTVINDRFGDDTGHGTAVAAIIHKMAAEAPLVAVKLESFDRRIVEALLGEGIRECLKDPLIRIINISMGIAEEAPSDELLEACRLAKEQGVAVVAACYNYPETPCYPAQLPAVYGVSTGLVKSKWEYGYPDGPVKILAKGTTQRIAALNNGYKIASGTSYATAHFSGILARLFQQWGGINDELVRSHATPDVQQLYYFRREQKKELSRCSKEELDREGIRIFSFREKAPFAKKILIYPVSEKEMKTVLEFPEQCRFRISYLLDYPVRLIAKGRPAVSHSGMEIIRDMQRIDYDSFDTLVCGYCLDQLADANIDFSIRLIKKCIAANRHFICWDMDVYLLIRDLVKSNPEYSGEVLVTRVTTDDLTKVRGYRDLPFLKTPVLAVIGTGNRQGKITTQLRLREILEREGYRVSLVSTEPQGLLLGADYIFPYGHKNPVSIHEEDWSGYLRIVMRGVQKYNKPDIIITGIQGGLLPQGRTISNDVGHNLAPLHFLLGVMPDAICCTINPNDEPDHVLRTLQTVRNYCHCPALCCLMTPWERIVLGENGREERIIKWRLLNEAQMKERILFFERELGLPVLDIKDNSVDQQVLSLVQDAFSRERMAAT